ncbi:hypothetical protein ZOSMA_81G01100 [Zostera marina]|uniref:DUF1677 family protein n=1 Tax=Zostera marina TaxID=29655 RepID=A0A0K9NMA2_ZOSMR|nr:hypothetical protein ZOSMA_81G01100 [Zostera marina]
MTSTEVRNNDDQHQAGEVEGSVVELAKCECCELTEECTVEYMARVKASHNGRWICGLCAEAVKDEIFRSEKHITIEEALDRHTNFQYSFSPSPNPTIHLILAVRRLMRRKFKSSTTDREATVSTLTD